MSGCSSPSRSCSCSGRPHATSSGGSWTASTGPRRGLSPRPLSPRCGRRARCRRRASAVVGHEVHGEAVVEVHPALGLGAADAIAVAAEPTGSPTPCPGSPGPSSVRAPGRCQPVSPTHVERSHCGHLLARSGGPALAVVGALRHELGPGGLRRPQRAAPRGEPVRRLRPVRRVGEGLLVRVQRHALVPLLSPCVKSTSLSEAGPERHLQRPGASLHPLLIGGADTSPLDSLAPGAVTANFGRSAAEMPRAPSGRCGGRGRARDPSA